MGNIINKFTSYFTKLINTEEKKNYIDNLDLINKTIISLSFDEIPNFIFYLKNEEDDYFQYKSKINNYPNYLFKNNEKFSKNLFKNIKIKSILLNYSNNQQYYIIEDFQDNIYKLYSDNFYI